MSLSARLPIVGIPPLAGAPSTAWSTRAWLAHTTAGPRATATCTTRCASSRAGSPTTATT
eukprot:7293341-Prymnesium_polylepis.1